MLQAIQGVSLNVAEAWSRQKDYGSVEKGKVADIVPTANGAQADIRLDCNGAILMARLTVKSVQRLALAPGKPVYAVIKSVSFERS